VILLDVREDDEWAAGHAPGAAHMALSVFDPTQLDRSTPIVAICRSGNRSGKAAARLAEAGFTVWNMTGGMNEWQRLGLPVQKDDGSPGAIG
jgi:rhodanese-related sulfurtransferase